MSNQSITLAISGASGAQYGLRLLECLLNAKQQVYLMISSAAKIIIKTETDLNLPGQPQEIQQFLTDLYQADENQLRVLGKEQWMAPIASGSNVSRAMIVCPCSSATLSAIAHGTSSDLVERAADVILKERRQLIVVPREMPLSTIHLQNMLTLSQMGATVMPASPGFYHKPDSVNDMVDFVVARILDHLDIEQSLIPRWGETDQDPA